VKRHSRLLIHNLWTYRICGYDAVTNSAANNNEHDTSNFCVNFSNIIWLVKLASFNNLFSSSFQTKQSAVQSINVLSGNSTGSGGGGGGGAPSNNSLWVTPSGAVVTFGGQLVASPPPKK
jgi:hypothetical protein